MRVRADVRYFAVRQRHLPLVVHEIVTFPAAVDITNSEAVGLSLLAAFGPGRAGRDR